MSRFLPVAIVAVLLGTASVAQADAKRPNIVLIMADDMGFSDVQPYGSEIRTPNLDRLAKSGLRFSQFHNNARCCPTRASLLTGLYPHQAGVGHMHVTLDIPSYQGFLNDRCLTIGEALRLGAYRTYLSGKWHVGHERPYWPVDRGFDRSYSLVTGGSNYFRIDPKQIAATLARDDKAIAPDKDWYITDAISDNVVAFLNEHGRRPAPFFLYVAYTAPHWPLHAHTQDIEKYRGTYRQGWDTLRRQRHDRLLAAGLVQERWPLTPRDSSVPAWPDVKDVDERDLRMAVYAAQIDRMDQGIGKILAKLKDLHADDNTLIMFLSDNGGCAEVVDRGKPGALAGTADSFLSYGVGWANASNTPFRLYKHWVHEGGIATPLIVSWPAQIRTGAVTHQVGHIMDVMPTCLDVAGISYPQANRGQALVPLEGKSLMPIFRNETRPIREALFWEHEGNRAVRQDKWKLVARHGGDWELYDLDADRTELNNLAGKNPDRVKDLSASHERWAARVGVQPWDLILKKLLEVAKKK